MLNEFEKQVQQKMDELKFVPSEPVWQKVKMQIRKKKDRRRFAFWILFGALLTGGGVWIGIDQYSNRIAYDKINKTQQQTNQEIKKQSSISTSTAIVEEKNEDNNKKITSNKSEKQNDGAANRSRNTATYFSHEPVIQKKSFPKIKTSQENLCNDTKKRSEQNKETVFAEANISNKIAQLPEQKKNIVDSTVKANRRSATFNIISVSKEKMEANVYKTDSLKNDSTSTKKTETKKYAASKWKLNLTAVSGLSGLGRLNLFNGEKSLNAYPVYNSPGSSPGGFMYYGPSPVKKGFSFSVGALAKRQLTKRTSFSTGLQYNYYSNSINVGTIVNQSTRIMDFAVAQYYSNNSTVTQLYHNQYHFVSLPVAIDWRLSNKLPLDFHAGLSLQYLVKSNALRFDYSSQSYFHSIKSFNRIQLLSEFGFTYSMPLKQKSIAFGPQLQYGLSRLEKESSTNHLFSYGLKVQWQLKK